MNETSRAAFLAAGTAGAALIAAAVPAAAAASAGTASRPALEALLQRPAKNKQVIAAPKINRGAPLRYALNTLNAFQFAYGEGAAATHIACVFYGPALFLVAGDTVWGKYGLFDVLDAVADPLPALVHTPRNPFLHARSTLHAGDSPDDERGYYHDLSVEALTRRGVSFIVCNNALNEVARQIGKVHKADPKAVYADFRQSFAPGTMVVPAGVAALVIAQQTGFTFLPG